MNSLSNFGQQVFFLQKTMHLFDKRNVQKKGVKTSGFHGFDAISSKAVVNVNVNVIWLSGSWTKVCLYIMWLLKLKAFHTGTLVTLEAGDDGWWRLVSWAGSSAHLTQKGRHVPPLPPSAPLSVPPSPSAGAAHRQLRKNRHRAMRGWESQSAVKKSKTFCCPCFWHFWDRGHWLIFFRDRKGTWYIGGGSSGDSEKKENNIKIPFIIAWAIHSQPKMDNQSCGLSECKGLWHLSVYHIWGCGLF